MDIYNKKKQKWNFLTYIKYLCPMKKSILTFALAIVATLSLAQAPLVDSLTFRGTLVNDEYQIWLEIDFNGQSIVVPDQELFGMLPGYLGARRDPRKWLITSAEITSPSSARLEIINDYGSEDLVALLTLQPDGTYLLRQTEGSPLRIVVNSKWLKLPKNLILKRKEKK